MGLIGTDSKVRTRCPKCGKRLDVLKESFTLSQRYEGIPVHYDPEGPYDVSPPEDPNFTVDEYLTTSEYERVEYSCSCGTVISSDKVEALEIFKAVHEEWLKTQEKGENSAIKN